MCQVLRIQHRGMNSLLIPCPPHGTSAGRLTGEDCGRLKIWQHLEGGGQGADDPDLKMEEGFPEEVIPT